MAEVVKKIGRYRPLMRTHFKNKKSLEVRKKFAEKMAHSRELSEQYEKIIVGDADDGP